MASNRKLKRPDGWLCEEYIAAGGHLIEGGEWAKYSDDSPITDHSASEGEYTGRFWFQYLDGCCTRRYTQKTAPKWLLALYLEATSKREW